MYGLRVEIHRISLCYGIERKGGGNRVWWMVLQLECHLLVPVQSLIT